MRPAHGGPKLLIVIAVACTALLGSALAGCDGNGGTTTTLAPADTTTPLTAPGGDTSTTAPESTSSSAPGTTAPMSDPPQTTIPPTTILPETSKTTVQPPYTPAKGDPERAAIMDAQRAWMASKGLPSDVVFVVDWLRISDGWAYSEVRPQSVDGANKYEGIMFLLRDTGGWKVVDVFGTEGEMSEDLDPTAQLMSRNPGAPSSIFP